MAKRTYIRIISFLSVICVLLGVTSAVYAVRANRYSIYLAAERERSLAELAESLDGINVSLHKSMYCSTGAKLLESGNELYRLSTMAKDNLSELTEENLETETIFKFLSQVGDYTIALAKQKNITEEQRQNLTALYQYSNALASEINRLADGYYDGEISFEKAMGNLEDEEESIDFLSSFSDAEQALGDYPTLLYDGPFADSVLNREAVSLKGENEITKEEGRAIAAELLDAKPSELKEEADQVSQIPLFCFSLGEKTVGITKQGGYVCYITNPDYTGEATISEKEALKRGENFLKDAGFSGMVSSYYSNYDDVCTINYAYRENGITYYADLIKVSVALDTGKVVAMDARGYLMNHCKRNLPLNTLSQEQCRKSVASHLEIIGVKPVVIPLDTGKEEYCMEYHCRDIEVQEVLIYIDCETGEEAEIMLLLYSDDGVLTK